MPETVQKNKYEEKVEEYKDLRDKGDDIKWKKGDMAKEVEIEYGKKRLQKFSEDVNEPYNTLRVYKKVAAEFENDKRLAFSDLTWSHFFLAASTDNPDEWLKKSSEYDFSTTELKKEIKDSKSNVKESERQTTSLSINKKIFNDFKYLCKQKRLTMSYVLEDFMNTVLKKDRMGEDVAEYLKQFSRNR